MKINFLKRTNRFNEAHICHRLLRGAEQPLNDFFL